MSEAVLSTTRQAIAVVSRDYCRPLLKPLGFKNRGTAFWRERDGLLQDIAFQASMWGNARTGSFTINIGITHPEMYRLFVADVESTSVSAAHWPIQARIGFLTPEKREGWWDIDELTDVAVVGEQVSESVSKFVVPFLDALSSRAALGSYLRHDNAIGLLQGHAEIARALFAYCSGLRAEAITQLRSRAEMLGSRPGRALTEAVLERLEARLASE